MGKSVNSYVSFSLFCFEILSYFTKVTSDTMSLLDKVLHLKRLNE